MKTLIGLSVVCIFCIALISICSAEEKTFTSDSPAFIPSDKIYLTMKKNDSGPSLIVAAAEPDETFSNEEEEDLDYLEDEDEIKISDPLEPLNRFFFNFNDKLYFWVLKPLATGYATVIPEGIRIPIKSLFTNLATPVRFVNNLLQFKVKSAGSELLRFGINSTVGMLGLYDVAKDEFGIRMQDEDLGQTLGVWGIRPVIYITWPVLGPSTLRDSFGLAGDSFLDPVSYVDPWHSSAGIKATDRVNSVSLSLGDYEELKKDALDPYTAVRDVYYQYRESKIDR